MRIIGNDQKNNGQNFWKILERIIGKILSIIGAGLFSKEMVNIWHEYKVRTCNFMTYKYMHVHYNSIVLTDLRIKLLVHILLQRVSFLQ